MPGVEYLFGNRFSVHNPPRASSTAPIDTRDQGAVRSRNAA